MKGYEYFRKALYCTNILSPYINPTPKPFFWVIMPGGINLFHQNTEK